MALEWGDIRTIVEQRRSGEDATKRRMIDIRDRYHGDYVIPMPSVEGHPEMEPPVPRLIADGIDHAAMFASSVMPVIGSPALDPSKERGVRSREYAAIREHALYGHWHDSQIDIQIPKSFRQLTAYGSAAWIVVPDFKRGIARIEMRDALTTYAEQRTGEDVRRPLNVAFLFGRSSDWLRSNYPEECSRILGDRSLPADQIWDLVEWVDEDVVVIGVMGPRSYGSGLHNRVREGEFSVELRRWPNRAGIPPVACGNRVTLDRIMGQMDTVIATNDLLGKVMGLNVLAMEKGIFPDRFVIGQDGRPPQLLSGEWQDGRTGKTNLLTNVAELGEMQSSPGPLTHAVADRLESAIRQSGGINPLASGLANSNLRTGRSIDNFQSVNIEPRIAELQKLMARMLVHVNEAVMAVEKGYFGNRKIQIFSGWAGAKSLVEYTPNEHYETEANVVNYQFPGTDAAGATVTIGQLVGAGLMSDTTGRTRHPWIEDPSAEGRLVIENQLEKAVLAGVQQQTVAGALPVRDVARIKQLVSEGHSIEAAVLKANEEAQERQATLAPPPAEGQIGAPEAQPGLAQPGVGAEQPQGEAPPTIEAPSEGQQNLRQLMVALRRS